MIAFILGTEWERMIVFVFRLEEEKDVDGAIQQYQKCLAIKPDHKEARASLQQLSKARGRPSFNLDFLEMENGKKDAKGDSEEKDDGRKSRRRKKKKRGSSSSSSSRSSSSSSRFSSADSGSSRGRRKSRKSKKDKREQSLSPFSKKMAQLNPSNAVPEAVPAPQYPSTEYPSIATQPHPVPPPSFGELLHHVINWTVS